VGPRRVHLGFGYPVAMAQQAREREPQARSYIQKAIGFVEDFFYVGVAVALAAAGLGLFGYVLYDFVAHIQEDPFPSLILELLDGLLLVFIITELIHTIRAVINEKVLISEPFLVVGIVAVIRRMVVVSAQAKDLIGKPEFSDAMLETGLLTAAAVGFGLVIFLLRHTTHSEPRPEHEPQ
jgi:uncharacterized membrane protein (DUF373 family)